MFLYRFLIVFIRFFYVLRIRTPCRAMYAPTYHILITHVMCRLCRSLITHTSLDLSLLYPLIHVKEVNNILKRTHEVIE